MDNPVRDYAWGSTTLLAEFLGREPSGAPEAELWMGAHEGDPSGLPDGRTLRSEIVGVGHVEEARPKLLVVGPDQRILAGQVEVVGDQHQVTRDHARRHAACGVAQKHRVTPQRCQQAHAKTHRVEVMALVGMNAPL